MNAPVSYDGPSIPAAKPVIELYQRLLTAWNLRDAGAFAAVLDREGIVVGFDGSQIRGRAEVETTLRKIFSDHETAGYVAKVRSIRFLGEDTALLHAAAGMIPPGGSDLIPDRNAIQILVATREAGRWTIASFQNTPAAFHGRPDLSRQLTDELRQVMHAGSG